MKVEDTRSSKEYYKYTKNQLDKQILRTLFAAILAINWLILYYWTIVLHPLKKFDQLSNVYCSLANEKMKLQKGMLSDILQCLLV